MPCRALSTTVSIEGGRAVLDALLADPSPPTAVMTMSDITAIGILGGALDAGLSVPGDLSIVGFDDIPAASWTTPRLTTVHQPIRERGDVPYTDSSRRSAPVPTIDRWSRYFPLVSSFAGRRRPRAIVTLPFRGEEVPPQPQLSDTQAGRHLPFTPSP